MHGVEHVGRQFAAGIDARAGGFQHRDQAAGTLDVAGCRRAGIGRLHVHRMHVHRMFLTSVAAGRYTGGGRAGKPRRYQAPPTYGLRSRPEMPRWISQRDQMEQHDNQHDSMIAAIENDTRDTADWTGRTALSSRVLDAMRTVRREAFVPEAAEFAYENRPLVIGHGQTISQPFIVALMTDLLDLKPDHVVLEVGAGSGYQAAVLAALVRLVFSIEVIPELADRARAVLAAQGFTNVAVRLGDGAQGWPEHAPFDAIIVTAAAPEVPPALVAQLRAPGRGW